MTDTTPAYTPRWLHDRAMAYADEATDCARARMSLKNIAERNHK